MFPKTPQCTDAKSRVKQRCGKEDNGSQGKQANCRQAFQCIPNDSHYHCSQHDYPHNHFHYMVITINMIMIIHDKHYRYNHLRAQTHTANVAQYLNTRRKHSSLSTNFSHDVVNAEKK